MAEGLRADDPNDAAALTILAIAHQNMGLVHNARREDAKTEENYLKALGLYQQLVRLDPDDPVNRKRLASMHNNIGLVYDRSRRPVEARAALQQSLELHEALRRLSEGPRLRHGPRRQLRQHGRLPQSIRGGRGVARLVGQGDRPVRAGANAGRPRRPGAPVAVHGADDPRLRADRSGPQGGGRERLAAGGRGQRGPARHQDARESPFRPRLSWRTRRAPPRRSRRCWNRARRKGTRSMRCAGPRLRLREGRRGRPVAGGRASPTRRPLRRAGGRAPAPGSGGGLLPEPRPTGAAEGERRPQEDRGAGRLSTAARGV